MLEFAFSIKRRDRERIRFLSARKITLMSTATIRLMNLLIYRSKWERVEDEASETMVFTMAAATAVLESELHAIKFII